MRAPRRILQSMARQQSGGATLVAVLLLACLVVGLAGGFTARALTGVRKVPVVERTGEADVTPAPTYESSPRVPVASLPEQTGEEPPASPQAFDTGRATATVDYLAGTLGYREQGTQAETAAAGYIVDRLREYGYQPYVQEVPITVNGRVTRNVIAELPGTQRPSKDIVVGAHMDSRGGPGANDNATGVAVVLELARILKANARNVPAITFVFFGGEERTEGSGAGNNHWGSRHYVANLTADRKAACAGMVSVDMVGKGTQFLANSMGLSRGTLKDYMLELGAPMGMGYRRDGGLSDHMPFEKAGIPTVWLEYREPAEYHQPTDTPAAVDYGHVQQVGSLLQQFFEQHLTGERVDAL
ncbi:MAG: M28 family metallopeptidase [Actinomycetota bacterium]